MHWRVHWGVPYLGPDKGCTDLACFVQVTIRVAAPRQLARTELAQRNESEREILELTSKCTALTSLAREPLTFEHQTQVKLWILSPELFIQLWIFPYYWVVCKSDSRLTHLCLVWRMKVVSATT